MELYQIGETAEECSPQSSIPEIGLTVCLITALTVADFVDADLTINAHTNTGAQVGVLTLTAILREKGFKPHVVNLDELFLDFLRLRKVQLEPAMEGRAVDELPMTVDDGNESGPQYPTYFFQFVLQHLRSLSFDVFGLSSICSSYPLTLRLAEEIKQFNPNAKVILGGPQASVVDMATMRAFSSIDFIIRGEADDTLPVLLDRIAHATSDTWENIPGLTFRNGDVVVRNNNAPVPLNLDRLPVPAFDLDPHIRERGGIHLEIGRGCPFACTFCSTNDFFRRNFRLKSPRKMLEEMKFIKQEYGISYFSLIHDMYTIDRKKVVSFCQALKEHGNEFTWGCSARTDCVDDELIALMADAGCRGIFFGIETGSQRMQSVINKKLDLVEAWARIQCADQHGIDMAIALIIGFPEETRDDLRETIHFFIDSLRFDHAEPQISLLAPLAATPIFEQYKDRLVLDYIFSDMSYQGWRQDPTDVEMMKEYPEIFPNFYAVPSIWLNRSYLKELEHFVTYLATWFRWLPVGLLQDSCDFLKVFDSWRQWLAARTPCDSDEDIGSTPYYSHRRFRKEFLEFVESCYLEELATARPAIVTLCRTEAIPLGGTRKCTPEPAPSVGTLDMDWVPYSLEKLIAMDLELDYKELIESLRNKAELGGIAERSVTVVFRTTEQKVIEVWQLAPLSAMLLHWCDGNRTIREIMKEFCRLESSVNGIASEKVCLFGLMQLRKEGFIGFSLKPLQASEEVEFNEQQPAELPRCSTSPQALGTQQPWPPLNAMGSLSTSD